MSLPPLHVTGAGAVGPFGAGLDALGAALAGPLPVPRSVTLPGGAEAPVLKADDAELARFVERGRLRRMDHYARLALLGAHLALADAGHARPLGPRMALVVASGYGPQHSTFGFLDSMIDGDDALASPTAFSNSVHNAAAAQISMELTITGPNLTVTQGGFASALWGAAHLLAEGAADTALVGAVDEIHPAYAYGLSRIRPEEVPGEGAAFFLLSQQPGDARYGALTMSLEAAPNTDGDDLVFAGGDAPGLPARARDTRPLFGALPTRAALDLAAAALALRRGQARRATVLEWDGVSRFGALRLTSRS